MNLDEIKTKAVEAKTLADSYGSMTSDDFGHNTEDLLVAESNALGEVCCDTIPRLSDSVLMLVGEIDRLNQKSQKLVEALESIAAIGVVPDNCVEYFSTHDQFDLVDIVSTDTDLARQALKEWGEL